MKKSDIRPFHGEFPSGTSSSEAFLTPNISAYTLYSLLRDWFGSSLPSLGDPVQWSFMLQVPGAQIGVSVWELTEVVIIVYPEDNSKEIAQKLGEEFVELIKKQVASYPNKRKAVRDNAENYALQNPFSVYLSDAKRLLEMAKKMNDQNIADETTHLSSSSSESQLTSSMSKQYHRQNHINALLRSAFFLYISAIEGFMNVIYEIYLKPELRDAGVSDRLSRDQIDLKITLAPLYCLCFKREKVEYISDEFDRFRYIIGLRNNFIHANLTDYMKTALIVEDDYQFIVEPEIVGKYELPFSIVNLSIGNLEFIQKTVLDMKSAILNSMKTELRGIFKKAVESKVFFISIVDGKIQLE